MHFNSPPPHPKTKFQNLFKFKSQQIEFSPPTWKFMKIPAHASAKKKSSHTGFQTRLATLEKKYTILHAHTSPTRGRGTFNVTKPPPPPVASGTLWLPRVCTGALFFSKPFITPPTAWPEFWKIHHELAGE